MPSLRTENTILRGDCVKAMAALPEGRIDLAFADPPFNIGYEYDVYDDKQERTRTSTGRGSGSRPSIAR